MNLLAAALNYAERGYKVFPCLSHGKRPATPNGCLDATTDIAQIEAWWGHDPKYNVAIATEGMLVVDVDPEGLRTEWYGRYVGELAATAGVKTPRGGMHYYYQGEGWRNTAGKLAPGIDTRGTGGYVLAPPSVVMGDGINGKYEWVYDLDEIVPVPGFLVEALNEQRSNVRLSDDVAETIPEGQRNMTMTRFAGMFRRGGMTEEEIFTALSGVNATRCQPQMTEEELRIIAGSVGRYEPDLAEEMMLHSHLPDEDAPVYTPSQPLRFPQKCLDEMPLMMRESVDWMLATAIKPNEILSLAATICCLATLYGQLVQDDYETRTNIMICGLAPSGSGKEHPRECVKRLLTQVAAERAKIQSWSELLGPERVASSAGITAAVALQRVLLMQLDEIGRFLTTTNDGARSPHLFNIPTILMQLFSSSKSSWKADAYADTDKNKTINQPCLSVFGTSVGEIFYRGLTESALRDGFVSRLIVLECDGYGERQKPEIMPPPQRLVNHCIAYNNLQVECAAMHPNPRIIAKTPAAEARHEEYSQAVHDRHRAEADAQASIWSRAPEKVGKLALIYACAAGEDTPVITLEAEDWAIRLVNYATRTMIRNSLNCVSSTKHEADVLRLWRGIESGMTMSALNRKTQWINTKARDEMLHGLEMSGALRLEREITTGRPKTTILKLRETIQ